jgi:hypothetical protein
MQRTIHVASAPLGEQVHIWLEAFTPFSSSFWPPVFSTTTGKSLENPTSASCRQQEVAAAAGSASGGGACALGTAPAATCSSFCLGLPAAALVAASRQASSRKQLALMKSRHESGAQALVRCLSASYESPRSGMSK